MTKGGRKLEPALPVAVLDIASVKEGLVAVEGQPSRKIEAGVENLARIITREFGRVHGRTEALARHVGYTFEPKPDEGS